MSLAKAATATLRLATPTDAPTAEAIDAQASPYPWSLNQHLESINRHHYYLIESNSNVSGFLAYSRVLDDVELLNIAVKPSAQGKGIGRQLLTFLLSSQQNLAKQIYLEVRASNNAAINLYKSVGFEEIHQRKAYYPSPQGRENALIMCFQY